MSKRYLVEYTGPLEDPVSHINGKAVPFFAIKIKGGIEKVAEVTNRKDYTVLLRDSHISPYVPCPEALKQLNRLQKEREKALAEALKLDQATKLETRIKVINAQINEKQEEIVNLVSSAKVMEGEVNDLLGLVPVIEEQIKSLFSIKKRK